RGTREFAWGRRAPSLRTVPRDVFAGAAGGGLRGAGAALRGARGARRDAAARTGPGGSGRDDWRVAADGQQAVDRDGSRRVDHAARTPVYRAVRQPAAGGGARAGGRARGFQNKDDRAGGTAQGAGERQRSEAKRANESASCVLELVPGRLD